MKQCHNGRKLRQAGLIAFVFCLFSFLSVFVHAEDAPGITGVDVSSISVDQAQIRISLSQAVTMPKSFMIEQPAKIVFDFKGVKNLLDKKNSQSTFSQGVVRKLNVVEGENRTRVVLDLSDCVPYEVTQSGNDIVISLSKQSKVTQNKAIFTDKQPSKLQALSIKNVDFKRGPTDEGRLIFDLSSSKIPIDLKEESGKIIIRFFNTHLPAKLQNRLDVTDFGTPIQTVDIVQSANDTLVTIEMAGQTESMAYQADNHFTVEVRKLTSQEKEAKERDKFEYKGERLSLNFQDIEVRAVLQLIADFTGLNIVTSDSVNGNVTLRLRNVPWDQALAIILKTKGLDKRQIGNVMLIGPSEEIAAREKLELQTNQQAEALAPLRSEYIQVNYAKAMDIANLLKDEHNSLLSTRGSASVDERTNTLLVQDTSVKLDQVRALVHRLDIPIRQVLIESRVVFANDDFEDAMGIRFGGALKFRPGREPVLGATGTATDASLIALGAAPSTVPVADRLGVNLPASLSNTIGQTAQLGLSIARLPGGTILDLELMALEAEGLGKIIASPRLVTSNQQLAYIEAGEEIPYQESTSSGAAAVAFKKAVLRLEVIPQITPDDHVFLDLKVNQDSRGRIAFVGGPPAIDTRQIHTKVLVANGDTVVLGGIYQQTKSKTVTQVPFLGRLPVVGWLFKSVKDTDNRNELMIFVTPKIVQEGVG